MNNPERYKKSEQLLQRALATIPLGSQTFSKSLTQYPHGASPFFIERAKGSRCWDVDGNEYIDFVNGLCAVNLGHCDPDVSSAVRCQLERGTIFSLPSQLEMQVAEKLVEFIPNAEMVRFGKNGSDATTGAIRLARAITRRDHVAMCGYHGWQDWSIGTTTRNLGVPKVVQDLTHRFQYNQIASLDAIFRQHPDQVAAVILEPVTSEEPRENFLSAVRELAHRNEALLVFDETITGFRIATGGAQEYFGVQADLATFGKGMANGYPISAITGPAKYLRFMEDIFFSSTFAGETLSLAAALATLEKIQNQNVIECMRRTGTAVLHGVRMLLEKRNLKDWIGVSGLPSWSFLSFQDHPSYSQWQIKTLFLQEILQQGILAIGTHNISFAHTDEDVNQLLSAYDRAFTKISRALETRTLEQELRCPVLQPLFKVR